MTSTEMRPAVQRPRMRRRAWFGGWIAVLGGGVAVAAAAAVGAGTVEPATPLLVSVTMPVMPPAAPPTVVTQVVSAPPPPAPPAPAVPPRARGPMVNPDCLLVGAGAVEPPSCSWDDGFPAISADGTRIAVQAFGDDPGRSGAPPLSIDLIDVGSSRHVRSILVLSPEEADAAETAKADAADFARLERVRARVRRRAAAAQRVLDAGGYRAMDLLGSHEEAVTGSQRDREAEPTEVYADIDGELVRAIDPATHRVLWQGRFTTPAPGHRDPDEDCGGWGLASSSVGWDPSTRIALVQQLYFTGGCMCGDYPIDHVRRMR